MVSVIVTYLPVRVDIDDIRKWQDITWYPRGILHSFPVNTNSETADQPKHRNKGLGTKANMITISYLHGSTSPLKLYMV